MRLNFSSSRSLSFTWPAEIKWIYTAWRQANLFEIRTLRVEVTFLRGTPSLNVELFMYSNLIASGSAQMIQFRQLIQTSNLISQTQFIFTMYNSLQCLPVKIKYRKLCIRFGTWKAPRLKRKPKSKLPFGPVKRNSWVHSHYIFDSNVVDLFMYLIEEIRFGTWKVRRLS